MTGREVLIDEAMSRLDALIARRRRSFCDQPIPRDVSMPQMHILIGLQERGPTTVSDLAVSLEISIPSASAIVDRMEDHGLVRRVRDEDDRRVVHVTITERGAQIVEEMVGLHREGACRLLGKMTGEELEHVTRALAAVQRVLSGI